MYKSPVSQRLLLLAILAFFVPGWTWTLSTNTQAPQRGQCGIMSDSVHEGGPFKRQCRPSRQRGQCRMSGSDYEEGSAKKRRRPIRKSVQSTAAREQKERARAAQVRHEQALQDPTLLTNVKFADRDDIHPNTKRAIAEKLGLQQMTEIQQRTWSPARMGQSVLGRSKTGTGKTGAYLIPAIERLLETDLSLYRPGHSIGMLVVVPTRELAIQIADEATALLSFHEDAYSVQSIYGGTKFGRDVAVLNKRIPTVLVATPGRLQDHLDETRIRGRKFGDLVTETQIVVLDETDRLLEGFHRETKKILSYFPRPDSRQTLLFSATVPRRLRALMNELLPVDHVEVDCIGDSGFETNVRVEQSYIVLPGMEVYISGLASIVRQAMQDNVDYKVLVFFPAAKLARFFAILFNNCLDIPVLEIHSRMSQSSRNRVSSTFRSVKRGVLFSSDVSARGIHYPDVSLVVQYGAPFSKELYIHRLGRTGRAGKEGTGLLVLMPFETKRLACFGQMGLSWNDRFAEAVRSNDCCARLDEFRQLIQSGHGLLIASAEAAYLAFVAYYVANTERAKAKEISEEANVLARSLGLAKTPPLPEKISKELERE